MAARRLVEFLADRQVLLVLDNCEHLLPACAALVHTLLPACPELRVPATSREPLGVGGEVLHLVPPLSTPAAGLGGTDLARNEAVELFVARTGEVRWGWALTADNADAVAELCRRLDGLPLAIELAAAWVRVLEPRQILDRLADRFALLKTGGHGVPPRQQTMRSCVEWSFELCGTPERPLWARLSVFAGSFEMNAIEGVCADEKLPETELLDVVSDLVDKSILARADARDGRAEASRFWMLETIRDFGHERLRETDGEQPLRRRHRDWHQRLAQRATVEWMSDRQRYWSARLPREHPNLRAAVKYGSTRPDEAEATPRLIMSVPLRYWFDAGLFGEARRWLDDTSGGRLEGRPRRPGLRSGHRNAATFRSHQARKVPGARPVMVRMSSRPAMRYGSRRRAVPMLPGYGRGRLRARPASG